jgi:CheY-like chemotaxis protein
MPTVALVVDDSMLIRFTVCRFLEERGFTVESASNGVEAMQLLARISPGLVVTDLDMPQMSGTELISALKANPETALIPIIVVAGRSGRAKQSETHADFTIYKDIDIESQLEKAISVVLGKAKAKPAAK